MLLEIQLCLRSTKVDGGAITEAEYAKIGPTKPFQAEGIGEEERSVVLVGCEARISDFKGRGASTRLFAAVAEQMERFTAFLAAIDVADFQELSKQGIQSDILLATKIDENTMDFSLPATFTAAAARLGLSLSLLVDAE